jgi:hypothetical protein
LLSLNVSFRRTLAAENTALTSLASHSRGVTE